MQQQSIAMIICWYGSYPWYFPYFIHSCGFNLTIDFYIITENKDVILNKPDNVKIIHKTFDELKVDFSEKLGFTVSIDYPYKLCDFRPAFGILFSDIIRGYDFWGHADIDVVFGNIRSFITTDILNNYDVISCRHDYITGTFCLFRNFNDVNWLFEQSRDYKKVFSSSDHYCFDECNFLHKELNNGASILDFPNNIQSMTWLVQKAVSAGKLRAFFDFIIIEGTPGKIKWSEGKIIYKDMYEAMLYHLIKFKEICINQTVYTPIPDALYFTSTRVLGKQYK